MKKNVIGRIFFVYLLIGGEGFSSWLLDRCPQNNIDVGWDQPVSQT